MALKPLARVGILVIAGLFFAVSGLLSYVLFPRIFQWQVEQKFVLSPDAETYSHWKDVPVPIFSRYYFFNCTNSYDVEHFNSTPILEEVGPYTFRETRQKVNITWNDNGTVSYRQVRRWFFQPDLTSGRLDDYIMTLNFPMISVANGVRYEEDFFKYAISAFIDDTNQTLYTKQTVRELLFKGYFQPLFALVQELKGDYVPYDHFGWMYKKNNTDDQEYNVYTGAGGMHNFGFIEKWNGSSTVNAWNGTCNQVNGTAGDMWPPFSNADRDELSLFISDICRSLKLKYYKDVELKGIKARRYLADHTLFDNGKYDPNNRCFCEEECLPAGLFNLSSCQHGAPLGISMPHFLYADTVYLEGVKGLNPNVANHSFYVDLEPEMGIPINVAARTQLNLILTQIEGIESYPMFPRTIFHPIFWNSMTAEVSDDMARMLRLVTEEVPHYVTVGSFVLVAVGAIILIFTFFHTLRVSRDRRRPHTYKAVRISPPKSLEL